MQIRSRAQSCNYLAVLGVLVLTSFFCTAQLFVHKSLPVAHDMVFHIFQADQFDRDIASGVILPRWILSANNGYGSPNFIFYAPLSYYLVTLLHLVVPSPVMSIILAIWCSFLLSGITMYLAVNRMSGGEGSLLVAMLYQILPFHLLNLYARGAFAELCAYGWFPLIILFMHGTLTEQRATLASTGLSLSYAGLILTHLVSAFMFSFMVCCYLGFNHLYGRCGKNLLRTVFSLLIGLGISSFYLLPVVFERKFVQIDYVFNYLFSDYRKNFLFLADHLTAGPTPFSVSLHAAVTLEMFLFLAVVKLLQRNDEGAWRASQNKAFTFMFICAFFLATPLSAPIWSFLPGFSTLQFPWRWVSMMELSLCFLVGAAFSKGNRRCLLPASGNTRMAVYSLITLSLVSLLLLISNDKTHSPGLLDGILDHDKVKRYTNLPKEYTPIWASDLEKLLEKDETEKVSILSGKANHQVFAWQPEKRVIGVNALTPVLLRISTFYYPGWEASIDGRKAKIAIENKSGAMLINLPQGDHTLKLIFGDTSLRVLSKYVSLCSCVFLALFGVFSLKMSAKWVHSVEK